MRTTATSSTRRAQIAADQAASPSGRAARRTVGAAAAVAFAAVALSTGTAGAAGAAVEPVGSGTTPIATPTLPRPCIVVPSGCRAVTSWPITISNHSVYVAASFPQGHTGWASYTLTCPDGFTRTATRTVAPWVWATLLSHDEHPTAPQTCTVTQNVAAKYQTIAFNVPPDSDELWASRHVQFTNVPKA